jgi:hypothetical protein
MTFVSQHRYKITLLILLVFLSSGALLYGYFNTTRQTDPWLRALSKAERYQQKSPDLRLFSIEGPSFRLGTYADSSDYKFYFIDQQGTIWCDEQQERLAALLLQLNDCGSVADPNRLSETALQDLAGGIHPQDAIKLTEKRVREVYQSIDGIKNYLPSGYIGTNEFSLLDEELAGSPLVWRVRWNISIEEPETKGSGLITLSFDIDALNGTIIREDTTEFRPHKAPPSN